MGAHIEPYSMDQLEPSKWMLQNKGKPKLGET